MEGPGLRHVGPIGLCVADDAVGISADGHDELGLAVTIDVAEGGGFGIVGVDDFVLVPVAGVGFGIDVEIDAGLLVGAAVVDFEDIGPAVVVEVIGVEDEGVGVAARLVGGADAVSAGRVDFDAGLEGWGRGSSKVRRRRP